MLYVGMWVCGCVRGRDNGKTTCGCMPLQKFFITISCLLACSSPQWSIVRTLELWTKVPCWQQTRYEPVCVVCTEIWCCIQVEVFLQWSQMGDQMTSMQRTLTMIESPCLLDVYLVESRAHLLGLCHHTQECSTCFVSQNWGTQLHEVTLYPVGMD